MTPAGDGSHAVWPGLRAAREDAAQRGSSSVGTQHLLFALLSRPDDDALCALEAGDVDPASAVAALNIIVGVGAGAPRPVRLASVSTSPRAVAILENATRRTERGAGEPIRDTDVLRALLTSDDPAVGQLIVAIVSSPQRVLNALDRA